MPLQQRIDWITQAFLRSRSGPDPLSCPPERVRSVNIPRLGSKRATLLGPDHLELGEIKSQGVGRLTAIGISMGNVGKSYRYTDPNEDAVCAIVGKQATILTVTDGHNGFESAEIAIEQIVRRVGEEPHGDLDLINLLVEVNTAILAVTGKPRYPHPESRAALVVAVITDRSVTWASIGDSGVFLTSNGSTKRLDSPRLKFIGYPMTREQIEATATFGSGPLIEGSWVSCVTDGLMEFDRAAEGSVAQAVEAADSNPERATRGIIERAFEAGAGDNVAVAVRNVE